MSEGTKDRRTANNFERHLQTGLVMIVIGLMGWVGITTSDTSRGMATLGERVSWMGDTIKELKTQLAAQAADRYTRKDAQRDYTQYMRRFQAIEARVTKLEVAK